MEMSQYLEVFIEESREHIQSLNENVLLLEKARMTCKLSMKFSVPPTH